MHKILLLLTLPMLLAACGSAEDLYTHAHAGPSRAMVLAQDTLSGTPSPTPMPTPVYDCDPTMLVCE